MKFFIFTALAAVALARPSSDIPSKDSVEVVSIVRDDRFQEVDGRYSFDFKTDNGIHFSEFGSPDGPEGAIITSGQFSFTAPDGTEVSVKYVANENGFQPESDALPVAPEFPHPIPQFVLDQIAFAAQQDAQESSEDDEKNGDDDNDDVVEDDNDDVVEDDNDDVVEDDNDNDDNDNDVVDIDNDVDDATDNVNDYDVNDNDVNDNDDNNDDDVNDNDDDNDDDDDVVDDDNDEKNDNDADADEDDDEDDGDEEEEEEESPSTLYEAPQ